MQTSALFFTQLFSDHKWLFALTWRSYIFLIIIRTMEYDKGKNGQRNNYWQNGVQRKNPRNYRNYTARCFEIALYVAAFLRNTDENRKGSPWFLFHHPPELSTFRIGKCIEFCWIYLVILPHPSASSFLSHILKLSQCVFSPVHSISQSIRFITCSQSSLRLFPKTQQRFDCSQKPKTQQFVFPKTQQIYMNNQSSSFFRWTIT